MSKFIYRALSSEGRVLKGSAEAESREALIRSLRDDGKFCVEAMEEKERRASAKALKTKDIIIFCRQMGAMLGAGISMSRALNTLYETSGSHRMKSAVLSLYEGVMKGRSLSATMQEEDGVFPSLLIHMTEAGEASGTLDVIMDNMSDHFSEQQEMRKKSQSAMIYPVILLIVAVAVVIFLLTAVMPQFLSMYEGVELPWPTRVLLGFSSGLRNNWAVIIAVLLALAVLITYLMTQKPFRVSLGRAALKLPVFGKLIRTVLTSRFASTFAILYSSGISVLRSMSITARVMHNDYVEAELDLVSERMGEGRVLSAALRETGVFDPVLLTMISAGEESGTLEDILSDMGRFFQKEAEISLSRMVAMIEPVMIVIMGILVGFTILAIMMPIFSMYQQII